MIGLIKWRWLRRVALCAYLPIFAVAILLIGALCAIIEAIRAAGEGAADGWNNVTEDSVGIVRRTWAK